MKIKEFPMCCGAFVLSDFGGTGTTLGKITPDTIANLNKEVKQAIISYGQVSFLMAILNEDQEYRFSGVLRKHGFEEVSVGYNDNHGGDLKLYVRRNPDTDD